MANSLQEKAEEQHHQQQEAAAWSLQQEQQLANMQLPQTANWAKNHQPLQAQPSLTLAQIQAVEAKEPEAIQEVRVCCSSAWKHSSIKQQIGLNIC